MTNPPSPDPSSSHWGQESDWQGEQPDWHPPRPGWHGQSPDWHGRREPDNYLIWAILSTLLCFPPFGIVSLVYAARVHNLWAEGHYDKAQKVSKRARAWAIAAAIAGPLVAAAGVVVYVFLVVLAVNVEQAPSSTTPPTPTVSVTTPAPTSTAPEIPPTAPATTTEQSNTETP
jgi:hypothetical protein